VPSSLPGLGRERRVGGGPAVVRARDAIELLEGEQVAHVEAVAEPLGREHAGPVGRAVAVQAVAHQALVFEGAEGAVHADERQLPRLGERARDRVVGGRPARGRGGVGARRERRHDGHHTLGLEVLEQAREVLVKRKERALVRRAELHVVGAVVHEREARPGGRELGVDRRGAARHGPHRGGAHLGREAHTIERRGVAHVAATKALERGNELVATVEVDGGVAREALEEADVHGVRRADLHEHVARARRGLGDGPHAGGHGLGDGRAQRRGGVACGALGRRGQGPAAARSTSRTLAPRAAREATARAPGSREPRASRAGRATFRAAAREARGREREQTEPGRARARERAKHGVTLRARGPARKWLQVDD
jgi:hypothetical protein